jgi:hypothetical protein
MAISVPEVGAVEAPSVAVGVMPRIGIVRPVGSFIGDDRLFLDVSRLVIAMFDDNAFARDDRCGPLNVGFALFVNPQIRGFGRRNGKATCCENRKAK